MQIMTLKKGRFIKWKPADEDDSRLRKAVARQRMVREADLRRFRFTTPYRFEFEGHSHHLTPIALDQMRQRCGIPLSYVSKIKPETMTVNLNRRIHELDNNRSVQLVSQDKDFSLIQGVLPPKTTYLPESRIIDLITKRQPDRVEVDGYAGFTVYKLLSGRKMEVKKGDVVESGLMICNPFVSGQPQINRFFNRLVCANGMIAAEFGVGRSLNRSSPAHKILDIIRQSLYVGSSAEELDGFRRMTEIEIGFNELIEAVEKKYKPLVKLKIAGIEQNFWDVYNQITAAARDLNNEQRYQLLEKAREMVDLFNEEDKQVCTEKVWDYYKVA